MISRRTFLLASSACAAVPIAGRAPATVIRLIAESRIRQILTSLALCRLASIPSISIN